jgi:hypothetical protein
MFLQNDSCLVTDYSVLQPEGRTLHNHHYEKLKSYIHNITSQKTVFDYLFCVSGNLWEGIKLMGLCVTHKCHYFSYQLYFQVALYCHTASFNNITSPQISLPHLNFTHYGNTPEESMFLYYQYY